VFGIQIKEDRWKRRIFLWLAVLSLFFSYPSFNLYFLAWLAPAFLFACLAFTPLKRSFRYGYFFGFLFNFFSLYWIGYVTGAGWIFAVFVQAIYPAFFAWGSRFLMGPLFHTSKIRYRFLFVIGSAGLWASLEWVRVNLPGFGFGWNLLSYSQAPNLAWIQMAEWIGSYGLSFFMVFVSSILFLLVWDWRKVKEHKWIRSLFYVSLLLACLGSALVVGTHKLQSGSPTEGLRVGVIQGNIPQNIKWDAELKDKIIEKYKKLSELTSYDRPDMILWPEASYPGFLLREIKDSEIEDLIEETEVPYLIGSAHVEGRRLLNAAIWMNAEGEVKSVYFKRNLVPFGEYIPFKFLFFFLEKIAYSYGVGDFTAGKDWTVFEGPKGTQFASLICFENIFPKLSREFTRRGAEFFTVITNDAWFERSRAPMEHIIASQFRAVETRRPFVHVANTGISGFVDSKGRIVDELQDKRGEKLFITGGMTQVVYPQRNMTFYVKYGHWIPLIAFGLTLLSLGCVFLNLRRKK